MLYLQIALGFVLLLGGAEVMVRGAVAVARRLGVSTLIIGMTVVAFGTSAPELVVSLQATLGGSGGMALGNLVGSNIANVLLILGAAALLKPIDTGHGTLLRDSAVLIVGTLLFSGLVLRGEIDMIGGIVLIIAFAAFLRTTMKGQDGVSDSLSEEVEEIGEVKGPIVVAWLMTIAGLIALLYGADQLVEGGTELARQFGVSEEVIGLTVIAFGTSLPELAASVVAALRGHSDLALGNVIGSNLFNILGIAGIVSVVHPIPVPDQIFYFDIWVMLIATLIMIPFAITNREFNRIEAGIFLFAYGGYVVAQATRFPVKVVEYFTA
ncbi:calcium/sodium antiporter [Magnetospira sp. QH-2]|uniref:calcium/sodium antiporter n=1 Tax=Magnetospira sp. (strain QH-2) TaxID=1288970 RepID=UPI0003E813CD|nr:calcium/sodium antiporter [Magnetospira sp. QH-2]CCQ74858.1 putative Na+/Ca+ exchanger protein [Magnetospira sp. QH-2]